MIRPGLAAASVLALAACSQRPSHLEGKQTVDYVCSNVSACNLHVVGPPAFDVPIPPSWCSGSMELAEATDGKTIGYRCHADVFDDKNRWSAVRLRGNGRYLNDCGAPLGVGDKPNFTALGSIESSSIRLLDCRFSDADVWREVARSIQEESGSKAAAAFEIQTALRPPKTDGPKGYAAAPDHVDGWVLGFGQLDAAGQAAVRAEICPAIHNPLTTPLQFVRALRTCPLDDATPDALRWLHEGLAAPASEFVRTRTTDATDPPAELNASELALAMAGSLAVNANPSAASSIACGGVAKLSREGDPVRVAIAGAIIASSKVRCAEVDKYTQLWPCDLESPIKLKTSEAIAQFAKGKPGAPPKVPSANYAMFEALTIGGKFPQDYIDRKTDGGVVGAMCP